MSGPILSTMVLPRAGSLTDALLAGAEPELAVGEADWVRERLSAELGALADKIGDATPIRVDGYRLRRAALDLSEPSGSFSWSPVTARRPLGLDAVGLPVHASVTSRPRTSSS